MKIHLEVESRDTGGWFAWVEIVYGGGRRHCVWSQGGTDLHRLAIAGAVELIRHGETRDIDLLRRRNAELEQAAAEAAAAPAYHLDSHTYVDGTCSCGAVESVTLAFDEGAYQSDQQT